MKSKYNRKNYIFKIATSCLIAALCAMTAFTSFASGVAGNIDNQNVASGPVGTGGDLGVTGIGDKSRIGLRFSLVDKTNPERVVSVNMAGEPAVIDLWFMSTERFIQFTSQNAITNLTDSNYFSAVKTQSINSQNSIQVFTWSDVAGTGLFDDIEPWISYNNSTKEFIATGKDFQAWEEAVVRVKDDSTGVFEDMKYGHIINMLNSWRDASGNYVFGTADTRAANKAVTDITISSNKDYKLLIEPITMFTPCYAGTSNAITTKVAGTLSNIAEYWTTNETLSALDEKYGAKSHLNWRFFNKTGIHSLAVTESMVDTVIEAQNLIYEDGFLSGLSIILKEVYINNNVATFENGTHLTKPALTEIPTMLDLAAMNQWNNNTKVGYAVNVFSLDGLLQTSSHTWNSTKYPNGEPGEAPDTPYVSEEENFVSVVKYYEDSKDSGITYETVGVYGKEDCVSIISIEDEPMYKIKEFFLSTKHESFVDGDLSVSYGEQKEAYKDVPVLGTGACDIEIAEPGKVLHILYQKSDGLEIEREEQVVESDVMTLYQNEISRPYDLSDLTENNTLYSLYEVFADKSGLTSTCNSSHDFNDDCRGNEKDGYWCDGDHSLSAESVQSDGSYSLSVKDSFDYHGGTSFIRDYITSDSSVSGDIGLGGGETEHFEPNASFLFYRNHNKDKITLYPEKNSASVLSRLKEFSILSESYVSKGTRMENVSKKDEGVEFYDDFSTHFEDTTADRELSYEYECSDGHNFGGDSYESEQRLLISELNDSYTGEKNAITKVYVGETNNGLATPDDIRTDSFTKKYKKNKTYFLSEADLQFYPMVEMKMIEKGGSEQSVFVTSENLSTMKVFNAIQLGVYKKELPNVNLSSTQWSTHRRCLDFLESNEIKDKQSVLPGGAILDLDLGAKGDVQLGIRSYQACLPDEQVKKVANSSSFNTSLSMAKEQSKQFEAEVKKSIEGYGLEMYVYDGVTSDHEVILDDGKSVHAGDIVKFASKGVKMNTDAKYYLRQDGEGASRANLDVLDSKIVNQIVYTIKSDTKGNVILYKDDVELARVEKNQKASSMLSNKEIKTLDDNTKLITNYFAAIDRNKGLDKENEHWYHEGFDGVSVLVTDYVYDIGFSSESSVRSTVLDTKLLGKAESKSDLYSFEEGDVRSLAFFTTPKSTTTNSKTKGYIATLAGNGSMKDITVYLKSIEYLAFTKPFYINNFSVSDLN